MTKGNIATKWNTQKKRDAIKAAEAATADEAAEAAEAAKAAKPEEAKHPNIQTKKPLTWRWVEGNHCRVYWEGNEKWFEGVLFKKVIRKCW